MFDINFGNTDIQFWGRYRAIDTFFLNPNFRGWGQQKFGRNPYFHFFFKERPPLLCTLACDSINVGKFLLIYKMRHVDEMKNQIQNSQPSSVPG